MALLAAIGAVVVLPALLAVLGPNVNRLAIFHRSQLGYDSAAMRLVILTVLIAFAAVGTTEWIERRRMRSRDPQA